MSTAPPIFVHVWAVIFKFIINARLVLDYRDQFSNNPMFAGHFKLIESLFDNFLVKKSDLIIVVSDQIKEYYKKFNPKKIITILNGYDERVFKKNDQINNKENNLKIFTYVGSIKHNSRIPNLFLDWLELVEFDFKCNFYGDSSLLKSYLIKNHPNLINSFSFNKNISYENVPNILKSSDINLVFEEKNPSSESQFGTIPTKIFEYIAVGVPVISEMSEKVMAHSILKESGLLIHNFSYKVSKNDIYFEKKEVNDHLKLSLSRKNGANKLLKAINEI